MLSTATHPDVEGQLTPVIWTEPPPFVSANPELAGFDEVRMLPPPSPAAQRRSATHETPSRSLSVGEPTSRQGAVPPAGSLETKIRPPFATATQTEVVVQETARRSGEPASSTDCHRPEAGVVDVKTLPPPEPLPPETATQSEAEGHETPVRCEAPA